MANTLTTDKTWRARTRPTIPADAPWFPIALAVLAFLLVVSMGFNIYHMVDGRQDERRDALVSRGVEYGITTVLDADAIEYEGTATIDGKDVKIVSKYHPDLSRGTSRIEAEGRTASVSLVNGRIFVDNIDGILNQIGFSGSDSMRAIVEVDRANDLGVIFPTANHLKVSVESSPKIDGDRVWLNDDETTFVDFNHLANVTAFDLGSVTATKFAPGTSPEAVTVPPVIQAFADKSGATRPVEASPVEEQPAP